MMKAKIFVSLLLLLSGFYKSKENPVVYTVLHIKDTVTVQPIIDTLSAIQEHWCAECNWTAVGNPNDPFYVGWFKGKDSIVLLPVDTMPGTFEVVFPRELSSSNEPQPAPYAAPVINGPDVKGMWEAIYPGPFHFMELDTLYGYNYRALPRDDRVAAHALIYVTQPWAIGLYYHDGVPPSVRMAQAIIESGVTVEPGRRMKGPLAEWNHFGIKEHSPLDSMPYRLGILGVGTYSTPRDGKPINRFYSYQDAYHSFLHHSAFLQGRDRDRDHYRSCFNGASNDIDIDELLEFALSFTRSKSIRTSLRDYHRRGDIWSLRRFAWTECLESKGYAEGKNYGNKLRRLIDLFELWRLDDYAEIYRPGAKIAEK